MASVNKVTLVGNLGKDPEVRYLPSGDAVANITIATSSKYKGKDGNMVEETEWHRVSFFGKLAEIVGQYLKKGRPVYVEGDQINRAYEQQLQSRRANTPTRTAWKSTRRTSLPAKCRCLGAARVSKHRQRHGQRQSQQQQAAASMTWTRIFLGEPPYRRLI